MKKNDFATFVVYIAMIAIALIVGFAVIQPLMQNYGASITLPPAVIMIIGLVIGALLNAGLLELGHVLGAKLGHYKIIKFIIFGVGYKQVGKKKKFGFHSYEGLVGETKVVPEDVKTSNLNGYILFPILFLFVEFIACMIVIVICQNKEATTPSIAWLHVFMVTILTVAGIVFLYDLFPAHIESVTDGYLLLLLSKPANKEAYNNMLLAEAAADLGESIPEMPIYEDITDFTASLNLLTAYRHLVDGEPDLALPILDPLFAEEANVSRSTAMHAKTLKLAILLEKDNKEKGKKMYEELDDADKKYVADVSDLTALRAYLLIASFIEGSEDECNYAIDKAEKSIKNCDPSIKESEKSLLQLDVDITRAAHPSWKVYPLPWEEKADEQ